MNPSQDGGDLDQDLMTITQAAVFLRLTPTELMAATRAGEVPYYEQRGRIWFSRSELLDRMRRMGGSSPYRPDAR